MTIFNSRFDDAKVHQQQAIDSTLAVNNDVANIGRSVLNLENGNSHIKKGLDATIVATDIIKRNCENIGLQNGHIISNELHARTQAADIKAHVSDIRATVRQIQYNLQTNTEGASAPAWAREFEKTMSDIVMSALLSQETQAAFREMMTNPNSNDSQGSRLHCSDQDHESPRTENLPQKRFHRKRWMEVSSYYRTYNSFLGTIYYSTKVLRTKITGSNDGLDILLGHKIETSFTIVPAPWLSGRGIQILTSKSFRVPSFGLRYFPVVPRDALVLWFSKAGNVGGMRFLFRKGLASPWDTDPLGYTPLHVRLYLAHNTSIWSSHLQVGLPIRPS